MNYLKGKFKQIIYDGTNGYKIGLFRVKETNNEEWKEYLNKTITFKGTIIDVKEDNYYILKGNFNYNERYQKTEFDVTEYKMEEPQGKDAVIEFLSSPIIKGCGEKTAQEIVKTLGEKALEKIKEDPNSLLKVKGMSEKKATSIYTSIIKYNEIDNIVIDLKKEGFSINDSFLIINKYGNKSKTIIDENIYVLVDLIDFNKLDKIYLNSHAEDTKERVKACIIQSFKEISFNNGDTFIYKEELEMYLNNKFMILKSAKEINELLSELYKEGQIIIEEDKYFLNDIYKDERTIADTLVKINNGTQIKLTDFDERLTAMETEYNIKYNSEQKRAIKTALKNKITIITGGPGTGKTTIINSIVNLYIRLNNLSYREMNSEIALLAPTGRASKRMMEATNFPSSTIHRYLKWNKDTDEFQVNQFNKTTHKLIIVDEVSMIDTHIFASLLNGLQTNIQLVLVGDKNQLPSVGPGKVLSDLIESDLFNHINLEHIYRQSDNSYIPILAKEIMNHDLSENFLDKKDDYNFIRVDKQMIKSTVKKICLMSKEKGLNENDIQVLAPMYKGESGIDSLNLILQEIFNPKSSKKKEIKIGDITYREHDKVLQLVNDPDNNVFNGDIGYIEEIEKKNNKDVLSIMFDSGTVLYTRESLSNIRHAYAISIHKSQGSEFNHVIIPVTRDYFRMLYNKLIYTGVSRAKKSLVIIGEPESFVMAVNNNYSQNRKTDLLNKLQSLIKDN